MLRTMGDLARSRRLPPYMVAACFRRFGCIALLAASIRAWRWPVNIEGTSE
jgi:hypothetical protein